MSLGNIFPWLAFHCALTGTILLNASNKLVAANSVQSPSEIFSTLPCTGIIGRRQRV